MFSDVTGVLFKLVLLDLKNMEIGYDFKLTCNLTSLSTYLKGENGSAGATFTVTGDFILDGEFLMANLGNDLRSNFTLGIDPNP